MRSRPIVQVLALFALAVAVLVPSGAGAAQGGLRCEEVSFPVTLSPGDANVYNVFGVLCSRGSIHHKTIQITLHGSTYSHLYWDWPFQPETYSYMRRATAAGYAVLNLDRIGIGQSDRPPAADGHHRVQCATWSTRSSRRCAAAIWSCPRSAASAPSGWRSSAHSLGSRDLDPGGGHLRRRGRRGADRRVAHRDPGPGGDLRDPVSGEPRSALRGAEHPGRLSHHPARRPRHLLLPAVRRSPGPRARRADQGDRDHGPSSTRPFPALGLSGGVHVPVLVVVGDLDLAFCDAPSCTASGSLATEPSFYPADACAEAVAIAGRGARPEPALPGSARVRRRAGVAGPARRRQYEGSAAVALPAVEPAQQGVLFSRPPCDAYLLLHPEPPRARPRRPG